MGEVARVTPRTGMQVTRPTIEQAGCRLRCTIRRASPMERWLIARGGLRIWPGYPSIHHW
jgi:hypothetical protein